MSNKIKLDLIVGEMEFQSDFSSSFYNKETREIRSVTEEEIGMAEDEVSTEGLHEWLKEAVEIAEEVLYGDIWIPLPSKFEINEYAIMEEFCLLIRNDRISEIMYNSIKGKGAFSRFRKNIKRYNIEDDWYKFQNEALKTIAIEWCESNNIDYEK
ncbi:MAG: hypothetical protein GX787_02015 [Tissierellia bacterium]|jgi:hypothetical protein|nr:hypothetical protein [Tissierellia bacterium]